VQAQWARSDNVVKQKAAFGRPARHDTSEQRPNLQLAMIPCKTIAEEK
jgi:hypothetical protein